MSPVDERDTIFARMARRPGTPAYDEYYQRRPERRRRDDRLRQLPALGRPGGRHYEQSVCSEAMEWFDRVGRCRPDRHLVDRWARRLRRNAEPTGALRRLTSDLGAVAFGCTDVPQPFVYSHKGRFDADYGAPISLRHRWAVVFLVEMDFDTMQLAPRAPVLRETARQYYRAALIAKTAAAALVAAGTDAKAHFDGHYDLILPPLAARAGLGELGRNNILIADRFGSRVRIGAVSTDRTLRPGRPRSLGASRFCTICRKCAESCPARALSSGEPVDHGGVRRWPTQAERCYGYWRNLGTDCGICMAVCPFSHRDSHLHGAVRWAVRRFAAVHRLALLCDDAWYGRRWQERRRRAVR